VEGTHIDQSVKSETLSTQATDTWMDPSCCRRNLFKNIPRQTIMSYCAKALAFFTPLSAYSFYLVLPYYVISTPEKGWTASDLALFYSAASVGEIAGSQVVPLAAVLDSNNVLFIGHFIQYILAFVGFFSLSSMLFFDYWVFTAGMFSMGFSYQLGAVQAYCTEIADGDENFEVDLMSQLGQLNIVSNLFTSFVLPLIYDQYGFAAYCATMMAITVLMLTALIVLVFNLKAIEREYTPSFHSFTPEESTEPDDDSSSKSSPSKLSSKAQSCKSWTSSSHITLESTSIPITSYLSPSMYMLLMLKSAQCFGLQVYCIATPVVFAQDFGISSQLGGVMYGMAVIFGVVGVWLNMKMGSIFPSWEYPYDISVYFFILGLSCLVYVVFYERWIAFSFNIFAMGSIFALGGIEMTCRLFLCPSQAFQQITGVVGIFQAAFFLFASIMAPRFLTVSMRFPYLVLTIMSFVAGLGALIVFLFRQRMLNQNVGGQLERGRSYLAKERAFYVMVHQSASRRGAILSDEQLSIDLVGDIQDQMDVIRDRFRSRRGLTFLMNPLATNRIEQFANNAAVMGELRKSQMDRMQHKDQSQAFNPNALIQMDEVAEINIEIDDDGDINIKDNDEDHSEDQLGMLKRLDSIHQKIDHISKAVSEEQSRRNSMTEEADKVSIVSAANDPMNGRRDSRMQSILGQESSKSMSPTRRSSLTMRKSIYQIAEHHSPKKKAKGKAKMSIARASMFRRCEPAIALDGNRGGVHAEREALRRAKSIAHSFTNSRKSVFMNAMGR